MFVGADLNVDDKVVLDRREEERITQAEKNKKMHDQLKVCQNHSL